LSSILFSRRFEQSAALPLATAILQTKPNTMSRTFLYRSLLPIVATGLIVFSSCEKSDVSADKNLLAGEISGAQGEKAARAFKADTKTRYRFAPILGPAIPVVVDGVTYDGTAYVPGDGVGNATHMGLVTTYFNQLSYIPQGANPVTTPPAGSVAAPVAAVPSYPFFLPPPPPGQPIDFSRLAGLITSLPIPSDIDGLVINTMFVNDKNEAVFGAYVGSSFIRPESPTRFVFGGKGRFMGGTGKFTGATGEFDYLGYFNPQNQDDAEYSVDGWIKY
jgi:hypothetical protein